jgi:hypothetical protein
MLGNPTRAEALAGSITGPGGQEWALAAVAAALAEAGELDRAEATARSIADPDMQAQALAAVAAALVRAGDVDQAEATARSITDPDAQARALAAVVRALVEAGDLDARSAIPERAPQLLALALAQTMGYVALLPVLAQVEPIAVIEAAQNIAHA